MFLIRRYATRGASSITYDPKRKGGLLVEQHTLDYFGFELERDSEPIEEFSSETEDRARHALAEAMARGQARHASVKKNRVAIDEIRQTYRRSGGQTPRFGLSDLIEWYEKQLAAVNSMDDFRNARFTVDRDAIVPREIRAKYAELPETVLIRDREVDIEYDVEEHDGVVTGVARLRLPEKLARTMTEAELPILDRPIRFVVIRGQRGAIRADTLDELQETLSQPWSPDELDETMARNSRTQEGRKRERKRQEPAGRGKRQHRKFRRR